MINKNFIPPPFKDWDWDNRTDRDVLEVFSRGQLMALCDTYADPLAEALEKRRQDIERIPYLLRPFVKV